MNKHAAMDGFRSYVYVLDVACPSSPEADTCARAVGSMSFEVCTLGKMFHVKV